MIETKNQSDSRANRLDQQNEDLLVVGSGNGEVDNSGDHVAGDQTAAAITTTVKDAGKRESEGGRGRDCSQAYLSSHD